MMEMNCHVHDVRKGMDGRGKGGGRSPYILCIYTNKFEHSSNAQGYAVDSTSIFFPNSTDLNRK